LIITVYFARSMSVYKHTDYNAPDAVD